MKNSIMFVDDSVNVLESLKWIFKDEPYFLFVFDNPDDALSMAGLVEFSVVVAEHSMKKMDGIELLKRVKEKSPHTIGLIMTGYVDFKEALDCIYPGCVYQYIKKPLDNGEIKQKVKSAIVHYEIISENKRPAAPIL
ncbi:response regulator [Thermodesulfobacteriota bacterium]